MIDYTSRYQVFMLVVIFVAVVPPRKMGAVCSSGWAPYALIYNKPKQSRRSIVYVLLVAVHMSKIC